MSSTSPDGPGGTSSGSAMIIDANNCATQPCDILTRCGCGSGDACDLNDALNGTICRQATSTGENTVCNDATDCAPDYSCFDAGNSAYCQQYCGSDADCGSPRGKCAYTVLDGANNLIPGLGLCSSNCDPLAQGSSACPPTWACDIDTIGSAAVNVTTCRPGGAATQGQACPNALECAAGLTCVDFQDGSTACQPLCAPGTNPTCPTNTTCTAFTPAVTVAGVQYGFCE